MATQLRLLILEDSPEDADLVAATLEDAGYSCQWDRAETREDFLDRLETGEYDLVLTDFSLPDFDGLSAIKLFGMMGLEIPIIQISGALDEEAAVESLKAGAADFVSKDKMFRLPQVVGRALKEAEVERQRKRAEATLRESERKFRTLVEHAGDGIVMLDPSGRYRDVNSSFCSMLGYSRDELLSMYAHEITVPEESPLVPEVLGQIAEGQLHLGEWRLRRRDGGVVPIEAKARKLPDGNLLGILRDITERRKSEEHKAKLQRRNEELVQAMAHIVYERFPRKDELRWEGNFTGILGYSAEEMGNNTESWSARVHPEDLPGALVELERAHKEQRLYGYEYRFQRRDGTYAWVEDRGVLTLDADGEIDHVTGVLDDITERKNLEEQYRQSQKIEAVGVLAGGIAHDFNNLLTAINGFSDLTLRRMEVDSPLRRNIEEIKNAGLRAAELTSQLLAFSRKQVLKPSVISLNSVVSNIENMIRRLIREDVELRTVLDPELGNVLADPGQIEQVIINLAINARDAMPKGGKLIIETSNVYLGDDYADQHLSVSPGKFVRITVSDTGVGMDANTQSRIFEPFFTTKEVGKGTGLGLATVYGIVKQSGGTIMVYSEPGHGTAFKIYLPCVDEAVETPRWSWEREGGYFGTETVLLVEDDDAVRRFVSHVLENYGYTVLEASNGPDALALCQNYSEPVHLLISDMILPKMRGTELRESVVEMLPDIKVLFMSGYTDQAIADRGMIDADTAFIEKPFTPDALSRKVREVLES